MMDLTDLQVFRAVVAEGGVTQAATKLLRVQSNVTKRIQKLEADLGETLFIREGRGLRISPKGRILLDYAERLLALADEAREAVTSGIGRGEFRIGAMESTAAVRLPAVLAAFTEAHPQVTLELKTGNPEVLSRAVLTGDLEAAFVAEPVNEVQFGRVLAFVEDVVLVTSRDHPAIEGPATMPETVLVFEHGCPHRRRLEEFQQSIGAVAKRVVELGSYHAMLGCVQAGMGAALVPKSVLASFPEQGTLRVHDIPEGPSQIKTYLVWRQGVETGRTRALAELLGAD